MRLKAPVRGLLLVGVPEARDSQRRSTIRRLSSQRHPCYEQSLASAIDTGDAPARPLAAPALAHELVLVIDIVVEL